MLLYEYKLRDEFDHVKAYAENIRAKFEAGASSEDLLLDHASLEALCNNLRAFLPEEVRDRGNLIRHLSWMKKRLREGRPDLCQGDISDICAYDIPELERGFREWCMKRSHYDEMLASQVMDLLLTLQYDSAIRKAFVVLKERLVNGFRLPDTMNGDNLVNHLYGSKGLLSNVLDSSERQATRDLLSGLYGLFRNKYGHQNVEAPWHEMEAVISMLTLPLAKARGFSVAPWWQTMLPGHSPLHGPTD